MESKCPSISLSAIANTDMKTTLAELRRKAGNMKALFAQKPLYSSNRILLPAGFPAIRAPGEAL